MTNLDQLYTRMNEDQLIDSLEDTIVQTSRIEANATKTEAIIISLIAQQTLVLMAIYKRLSKNDESTS